MSDSVRPHGGQPTRLLCPWDSPGKNTGVGCHFLLQCIKVKSESEVVQSCMTPSNPMDCSLPGSSVHGIFQARVLEWGAIAFSDISPLPRHKLFMVIFYYLFSLCPQIPIMKTSQAHPFRVFSPTVYCSFLLSWGSSPPHLMVIWNIVQGPCSTRPLIQQPGTMQGAEDTDMNW